jgi:indolepyruvate ferredoxin oxidoreductase beta subunit
MTEPVSQQLIISGVGGQGVLFVTRLLAEAAIKKGLPVFTSETHGMAQRGGTVLSHFKVGEFLSPLIRPMQADGLLALKAENLIAHRNFLSQGGWSIVNAEPASDIPDDLVVQQVDADSIAQAIDNAKAVNLIVLGFALARSESAADKGDKLFCAKADIVDVLENRFGKNHKMMEASITALTAGYDA